MCSDVHCHNATSHEMRAVIYSFLAPFFFTPPPQTFNLVASQTRYFKVFSHLYKAKLLFRLKVSKLRVMAYCSFFINTCSLRTPVQKRGGKDRNRGPIRSIKLINHWPNLSHKVHIFRSICMTEYIQF